MKSIGCLLSVGFCLTIFYVCIFVFSSREYFPGVTFKNNTPRSVFVVIGIETETNEGILVRPTMKEDVGGTQNSPGNLFVAIYNKDKSKLIEKIPFENGVKQDNGDIEIEYPVQHRHR